MFIGHYGVGLAAKRPATVSLGLLFLAVQFLDLLWPTLVLLNLEHFTINRNSAIPLVFTDYPYSHSLVMSLAWSVLFSSIYYLFTRNRKNAVILGLCVLSHWFLDLIVHVPDLPLFVAANSPKVGLGLWKQPVLTAIIESIIFITGLLIYLNVTRAKNKSGKIGLWLLITLLLVSHIANLFSPPPPSVTAVAWAAQLMWIFVILGFWVDKNRVAKK